MSSLGKVNFSQVSIKCGVSAVHMFGLRVWVVAILPLLEPLMYNIG